MISLKKLIDSAFEPAPQPPPPPPPRDDLEIALRQALRLIVENLPLHPSISGAPDPVRKSRLASLARRLQDPVAPIDPMEIATDALQTCELDHSEAEARYRDAERVRLRAGGADPELLPVLQQALHMLLEGLPAVLAHSGGATQIRGDIDALLRRLDSPSSPFDILETAAAALALLQGESDRALSLERRALDQCEESRRAAGRTGEICTASLSALRQVLDAASAFSLLPEKFGAPASGDLSALRRRLEDPLSPSDLNAVAEAVSGHLTAGAASLQSLLNERLISDPAALSGPASPVQPDRALQSALLQALHMILASLPFGGRPANPEGEARQQAMMRLLARLDAPLDPFDAVEIATDALSILELDSAALPPPPLPVPPTSDPNGSLVSALLDGLRKLIAHLPGVDEPDTQNASSTRRAVDALLVRLHPSALPSDLLATVDEALSLSAHLAKAARLHRHRHTEELQSMISMLSSTVASLASHRASSVARLQQIERRIEHAAHVEDLSTLRSLLGDCLQELRDNTAAQQKHSSETIQNVERQIASARSHLAELPAADLRDAAFFPASASRPASTEFVVVFLLDREASISSRFGADVHARILRFVQERLREALLPSDRLVRWKGAAFLASLNRAGSWQEVRAELASVASFHVPPLIDLGGRSIRLPVSLSWAVFPRQSFASLELLFQKVDDFIVRTRNTPGA